ncbi:MAG: metal-dependent hydrolase [Pseudomonadales bacterium]|nr:metal-dependent hydrolase [Pseudomonadales bacterium]
MANFNVHLSAGVATGGMLAGATISSAATSAAEALLLWGLCMAGSILPDIDSDSSTVTKMLFTGFAGIAAVLFTLLFHGYFDLIELWAAMLLVFLTVRFVIRAFVHRLTVHRGVFHSLLATVTLGLATIVITNVAYPDHVLMAFLSGVSITLGYLSHLLLDECYSVDLEGLSIKRSFGSAIKPFSMHDKTASMMMLLVAVFFYWQLPAQLLEADFYQQMSIPSLGGDKDNSLANAIKISQ